jgi:hypothetical protein
MKIHRMPMPCASCTTSHSLSRRKNLVLENEVFSHFLDQTNQKFLSLIFQRKKALMFLWEEKSYPNQNYLHQSVCDKWAVVVVVVEPVVYVFSPMKRKKASSKKTVKKN